MKITATSAVQNDVILEIFWMYTRLELKPNKYIYYNYDIFGTITIVRFYFTNWYQILLGTYRGNVEITINNSSLKLKNMAREFFYWLLSLHITLLSDTDISV
jgi:hypothetical protein